MSRENLHSAVATRLDSNQPSQLQKLATALKLWLSNYRYYTISAANKKKDADQAARMCRLICGFVVRIWHKQVFSWRVWFMFRSFCYIHKFMRWDMKSWLRNKSCYFWIRKLRRKHLLVPGARCETFLWYLNPVLCHHMIILIISNSRLGNAIKHFIIWRRA